MISKTIFVIQINLFVKWMTQNTLSFGIYGDGSKIVLAGCCTYTQSNSFIHLAKRFTVSSCNVSSSNQCA